MKLLFERSRAGRGSDLLPACDVPVVTYDQPRPPVCRRWQKWT